MDALILNRSLDRVQADESHAMRKAGGIHIHLGQTYLKRTLTEVFVNASWLRGKGGKGGINPTQRIPFRPSAQQLQNMILEAEEFIHSSADT